MKANATGVTLIELLISMVVLAVLISIAVPSFTTWLAGLQLKAGVENIHSGLQLARAEAVRRNNNVCFTLDGNHNWYVNMEVSGLHCNDNSLSAANKIQQSLGETSGLSVTFTPGTATAITFNPMGQVSDNTDGSVSLAQLDFSVTGTPSTLRIIIAKVGGQIRLCDPSVTTPGDPRTC